MNKKYFFLLMLLLAVGCASTAHQQVVPSQIPSVTISTATFTATPTETSPPIPSATWTSLPTIPPENLQQAIFDLVDTNKGCDYPCWWGITPGETNWYVAGAFLKTLSPRFWQPSNKEFTTVTFTLPDNWGYGSVGSVNFYVKDGIISSIRAFAYQSVSDVLSKYGVPDEIWIEYHEDELLAPHYSFNIALGYLEKGFMVNYFRRVLHDDKKHICPYRAYEPEVITDGFGKVHIIDHHVSPLSVWNPMDKKSFAQIIAEHYPSWNEFYVFKPLKEITNLDVNQFVDIYIKPNTRTCIEIKETQ